MYISPKNKWGTDRPWYWRLGYFVCSGGCNAEFPNHHLRNAHDLRFHPQYEEVEVTAPTYREAGSVVRVNVLTRVQRFTQYLKLLVLGTVTEIIPTMILVSIFYFYRLYPTR